MALWQKAKASRGKMFQKSRAAAEKVGHSVPAHQSPMPMAGWLAFPAMQTRNVPLVMIKAGFKRPRAVNISLGFGWGKVAKDVNKYCTLQELLGTEAKESKDLLKSH